MEERSQARGESALFIIILAAILIVLNIVSVKLFLRLDMTRNRMHSLSKGSLKIVETLKDRLTVKSYFTKNLPPPFNTTERYVRDLLDEYQARSGGKMKVEFIDPSSEELAEEARRAGIREVTHQVIEKDQASEKRGFRGIQFIYMGDKETIPVVTDTTGLEYEITSKMKQLAGEKSTVAFLQGHEEPKTMRPPPQDPYSAQQEPPAPLEETRTKLSQYSVREVDLKQGEDEIPEEVKGLVVIGPTQKLAEAELYRIDQFLMRGGSAAFFVDGIAVDTSTGMVSTSENDVGLSDFLAHFGVTIRPDIVFDLQCDTVPVRGPFGLPLATKYPGWPVVKIESDHPVTFKLPVLTFPWGSSLNIKKKPPAGEVEVTVLAKSSDKSWREEGSIQLEPSQTDWKKRYEEADKRGPFVLAAAFEGRFRSYFDGKELPQKIKEKVSGDFAARARKQSRILVTGSSQMVLDPIVKVLARLHRAGDIAANQAFTLNAVDWLTQEKGLIEIRAKGVENPRLEEVDDSTRNLIKYGNILAWPLLFLALGLVRWVLRSQKGKKKRITRPEERAAAAEKEDKAVKEDKGKEDKKEKKEEAGKGSGGGKEEKETKGKEQPEEKAEDKEKENSRRETEDDEK